VRQERRPDRREDERAGRRHRRLDDSGPTGLGQADLAEIRVAAEQMGERGGPTTAPVRRIAATTRSIPLMFVQESADNITRSRYRRGRAAQEISGM
jgi:hypothetical protein